MSALDRFKKVKLLASTPSNGTWEGDFGMSMLNAVGYFMAQRVGQYKKQTIVPHHPKGSILPRSRCSAFKRVLEANYTHLAFIDTDQTFPRDTFHRLILVDKDVVGCNIATKQMPASPTARQKDGTTFGSLVYTDANSPDYEKVWRIGAGVVMLKRKVIERIGLGCFEILWKPDIQDYMGEDWSMMEAIERAGFDIWVDHRLSDEVGHVGKFTYKHDVVGQIQLPEVANG